MTDVGVCAAPLPSGLPTLGQSYAMSEALEKAYLLGHIARLGRLTAYERICDLLLELLERLQLAGLVGEGDFE